MEQKPVLILSKLTRKNVKCNIVMLIPVSMQHVKDVSKQTQKMLNATL